MEKVHFTEARATMLGTLYGRALDSRSPDPVLGDKAAEEAVGRIDYDFDRLGVNQQLALSVVFRAKPIDRWTAEFIAANPECNVLHLGCGLDTRVYRLDPGPGVRWYDVDFPDVVELREKIYPAREGHRNIGTSVTDVEWLDQVPADRPTIMVAEGLTMYLDKQGGENLLRAIVDRFDSGQLVFDCFSSLGIRLQKLNPVVRKSGATLKWGIDDPRELESLGLTLMSELAANDFFDEGDKWRLPATTKIQLAVAMRIPAFRKMGRLLRYRF
ncbi:class I SAM-dependent methyltransferase [Amycolatopsis suaedae]|uniref:Class I SAM-dependent methyltransferase n=1 Tax=Amycolatopsis suaedae TaxID=2510978 RepID=A0A4Q7J6Q0_9PSEU|nr:class I SAM-dependent methyltransferase [Amycolatopsis suaedae]RZQ62003.1 class I SAM-dependent methyltransferase [Amycolatopsis suaedae]